MSVPAKDPLEEGRTAARENIPADGNPYAKDSPDHESWKAGHEDVAGGIEANETEGD